MANSSWTAGCASAEAVNPAELLLVVLSVCIIQGIERVVPILKFQSVPGTHLFGVLVRKSQR